MADVLEKKFFEPTNKETVAYMDKGAWKLEQIVSTMYGEGQANGSGENVYKPQYASQSAGWFGDIFLVIK